MTQPISTYDNARYIVWLHAYKTNSDGLSEAIDRLDYANSKPTGFCVALERRHATSWAILGLDGFKQINFDNLDDARKFAMQLAQMHKATFDDETKA